MSNLEGVIAVVGGSRGTGAELCRRLLEDGNLVVVGYAEKDTRAEQIAGIRHPVWKRELLEPPEFEDRATASQIDVTDPESRARFAEEVRKFAESHNSTVSTLALLGAAGIGQPVRKTFAVNQEGQAYTANAFWEGVESRVDPIALTLFAQSFQGHTAYHPDSQRRTPYPDDYAPVAISKWNGEVALRLQNISLNEEEAQSRSGSRHILAVVVGDALGDSDPIMLLRRRAEQAQLRIDSDGANEGDQEMVDQMKALEGRDDELKAVGFEPVTTAAYAALMHNVIKYRTFEPEAVTQITEYIPKKAVVGGKAFDLGATGTPLDWSHGKLVA